MIASPGAHSSDTSHVTCPDGDLVRPNPVNRSRSRRATAASVCAPDPALSLDIAVISVGSLDFRERKERLRPVLVYESESQTQPQFRAASTDVAVSLGSIFSPTEPSRTVTPVTCGRCSGQEVRTNASPRRDAGVAAHRHPWEEAP
jgi:hypothetical protein